MQSESWKIEKNVRHEEKDRQGIQAQLKRAKQLNKTEQFYGFLVEKTIYFVFPFKTVVQRDNRTDRLGCTWALQL